MARHKFKARYGSIITDDEAKRYGLRLQKLSNKNNGELTNELVLEDAKDTNSPYHTFFDWNDLIAGNKWRLTQAKDLIASIVKVQLIDDEKIETRAFLSVKNEADERVYVPIKTIITNESYRSQIIKDLKTTLQTALGFLDLLENKL